MPPRPNSFSRVIAAEILRAAQIFVQPVEARADEGRPCRNESRPQRVAQLTGSRIAADSRESGPRPGARRERSAAEAIAAAMLFQGRFGITTTQMAIQAATTVDPRTGESGHGIAFSISASAHAPATSNTRPTSNKSCGLTQFGALERRQPRRCQHQKQRTETIERRLLRRGHFGLERVLQYRGCHHRDGRENCHRADAPRSLLRDIRRQSATAFASRCATDQRPSQRRTPRGRLGGNAGDGSSWKRSA